MSEGGERPSGHAAGPDLEEAGGWRLWIDTGGTFTDCLAVDPRGTLHRAKVLSSSALRGRIRRLAGPDRLEIEGPWRVPDDFFRGALLRVLGSDGAGRVTASRGADGAIELAEGLPATARPGSTVELAADEEAPILAARLVTGTPQGRSLPPMELRLATTRGTNALLERRGARTLLLITRGFGDLLAIGNQQRPDLFSLAVVRPAPLAAATLEVDERIAAEGTVLRPLDAAALERALARLADDRLAAAAVCFLHSYRNAEHEEAAGEVLARHGIRHVSLSSQIAPLIKIVPRAETTVVDAYLSPLVGDYLERVARAVPHGRLRVMTSAGGLSGVASFRPKDSLLSGPAGGVVGAARAAAASGFERILAFDMGGTSTDVARFAGELEHRFETEIGDVRLLAPALAIESVAAGGGSLCRFDGHRLTVGPESAGATPGPACYGAGGPLTLTDVNLLLGRLAAERFEIPIDVGAAQEAAAALLAAVGSTDREALLAGFLRIADERMAEAIRRISVRRGFHAGDHVLVAFGGAGGQHACAVASLLGIATVLVPAEAALLSALGVGAARLERFAERQVLALLEPAGEAAIAGPLEELSATARRSLADEGLAPAEQTIRHRRAFLRLAGQESSLELDADPLTTLRARFLDHYAEIFGYRPESASIEVEALRVVASSFERPPAAAGPAANHPAVAVGRQRIFLAGAWRECPTFDRATLAAGASSPGPALILERHSATLVPAGWSVRVDGAGALVLERVQSGADVPTDGEEERA